MPERSIYRNAALEQLSTPERLDQYISVADTRAWLATAAAALCIMVAGAWAFMGTVTTAVPARGVVRPTHDVMTYVAIADAPRVERGMLVVILPLGTMRAAGGVRGSVEEVGPLPSARDEMTSATGSSVLADEFSRRGPVVAVRVSLPANASIRAGTVTSAEIVVHRRRPIDFLRPGAQ
jgi:hypothetical protein